MVKYHTISGVCYLPKLASQFVNVYYSLHGRKRCYPCLLCSEFCPYKVRLNVRRLSICRMHFIWQNLSIQVVFPKPWALTQQAQRVCMRLGSVFLLSCSAPSLQPFARLWCPFIACFILGNGKMSQGERSGLYGGREAWLCLFRWKPSCQRATCAIEHCYGAEPNPHGAVPTPATLLP